MPQRHALEVRGTRDRGAFGIEWSIPAVRVFRLSLKLILKAEGGLYDVNNGGIEREGVVIKQNSGYRVTLGSSG